MVRGKSSRRVTNGFPRLDGGPQGKRNGNTHLHHLLPADSAHKLDIKFPTPESPTIARLRGRERGPWGGGKVWLDMGSNQKLNGNISTRCRLLLARRYWGNTHILRAPIDEDFFPCSYRYRGHEGCVNAIKFHPTERWLCSGGDDLRLLIWEPRVWPRTPKTAIRTEHSDNIFCIDFDTLGGHALTAANDGLVTRINLSSSLTSETRDFHSLYRRLRASRVEEMRSLSLPLTHPDSTPGVAVAANPASAAAGATRTSLDALAATENELFFFQRGRISACFEAKFVDTAGQIAAAALDLGFVALADFRERPEVTHPVMRDGGDFTSVDPHLPLPFQLAYAGSCGAGILDLRTARPLLRLRVPGAIGKGPPDASEKCRGWSISSARRRGHDFSRSSTNSDMYTRPSTIEEDLELICRLRARISRYDRSGESDSSSPEASRTLRTSAELPSLVSASMWEAGALRSSSSSSSASNSRSSSHQSGTKSDGTNRARDDTVATDRAAPSTPGRGKRRCIRRSARQQNEAANSSQSSNSSANGSAPITEPASQSNRVLEQDVPSRTRLQRAVTASAAEPSRGFPQNQQIACRPRGRRANQPRYAQRRRAQQQREQHRQPRPAAVAAEAALRRISAGRGQESESAAATPSLGPTDREGRGSSREHQKRQTTSGTVRQGDTPAADAERQAPDGEGRHSRRTPRAPSASTKTPIESRPRQRSRRPAERIPSNERHGSRRDPQASGGECDAVAEGEVRGESARPTTAAPPTTGSRFGGSQWERDGVEEQRRWREEMHQSEEISRALRQAEAIAAQLPPIRFPTYRVAPRRPGDKQPYQAKEMGDVPLVEMVDRIVFSWDGRLLLAIRRRKEPLIYSTGWELPLFELRSEGYINFNTMKGGCFLTDGQHVACGSENLQVHLWRLPSPLPHQPTATQPLTRIGLLHGHLCVVNCCTSPAPQSPLGLWGPPMLATSGVEKMVRVWSWEASRDKDDCDDYPLDGRFVTHESTEDFLTIARFNRATPPTEMLHEVRETNAYIGDLFDGPNELHGDLSSSGGSRDEMSDFDVFDRYDDNRETD